jgi:hypothetical protein
MSWTVCKVKRTQNKSLLRLKLITACFSGYNKLHIIVFVFWRRSNTLWLQLYEFSRFRGIINSYSYGQRAVYEILATLATKISKVKVGRIKNLDFDRQKPARTSQKMFWFKSFRRFFNFPSSKCRSEARKAPSKSLKLVSSCPKIDFRAKLWMQKFLKTLPQTWINHKISMLACCIIDFLWFEFEKWIFAIFRRPQNSQGVDFTFSNLKQLGRFVTLHNAFYRLKKALLEPKLGQSQATKSKIIINWIPVVVINVVTILKTVIAISSSFWSEGFRSSRIRWYDQSESKVHSFRQFQLAEYIVFRLSKVKEVIDEIYYLEFSFSFLIEYNGFSITAIIFFLLNYITRLKREHLFYCCHSARRQYLQCIKISNPIL